MKAAEKKILKTLSGKLKDLKTDIESARDYMQEASATTQEKYDNLSEKAQDGERGEKIEAERDAYETVTEKLEDLEDLLDTVETAISELYDAANEE